MISVVATVVFGLLSLMSVSFPIHNYKQKFWFCLQICSVKQKHSVLADHGTYWWGQSQRTRDGLIDRSGPTPFMTLDLLIPYKNMKSVCAAIVPRTLEFIKSITQWLIFKYFDFFEGVGRVAGWATGAPKGYSTHFLRIFIFLTCNLKLEISPVSLLSSLTVTPSNVMHSLWFLGELKYLSKLKWKITLNLPHSTATICGMWRKRQ